MQELPNWFKNNAQQNFISVLIPKFFGKSMKMLQIGAYSGDASLWAAENLLTHPDSFLVDVDTWEGSDEPIHRDLDWGSVENIYNDKLWSYIEQTRVRTFKGTSDEFFKQNTDTFSFIYIDGDHTSYGVLKDAVNAFESLEVGGILAFDDYQWSAGLGELKEPRLAIDAFVKIYVDRISIIINSYQLWVLRIR